LAEKIIGGYGDFDIDAKAFTYVEMRMLAGEENAPTAN
jgi:hypothetical protein